MAKEIYEKVRNPKTAEDWNAQMKYLKQQLAAARKAQKNAAKQERLQREEEERNQQLAEALDLIEFMKGFKLNNGASAYDWMHAKFAEAKAQEEAAESAEEEVEDSDEETTDEDEAENTGNQYYQQNSGYYNN